MTLTFMDRDGNAKEFSELIGDAMEGQVVESIVYFRSEYESTAEIFMQLEDSDPRVKLIDYTNKLQPQEIGKLVLRTSVPDNAKRVIALKIKIKARLVK